MSRTNKTRARNRFDPQHHLRFALAMNIRQIRQPHTQIEFQDSHRENVEFFICCFSLVWLHLSLYVYNFVFAQETFDVIL